MRFLYSSILVITLLMFAACDQKRESPNFTYMPDMAYGPAYKAQQEGSMRMPPPGTIAQNQYVYPYPMDPDLAAGLQNPVSRTRDNILKGQKYYNIYCMVCHGAKGEGDGSVIGAAPLFPRPPTLNSEKIKDEWSDGRIFHVITMGQGLMSGYRTQMSEEQRWAVVHYLRALNRAMDPTDADLRKAEQQKN